MLSVDFLSVLAK